MYSRFWNVDIVVGRKVTAGFDTLMKMPTKLPFMSQPIQSGQEKQDEKLHQPKL
jgi:hypothetical protein